MTDEDINLPEVLAEVQAQFRRYEKALVSNDIATLDELFWNSSAVVRYGGGGENLVGIDAIRAFRNARPTSGLDRKLTRIVITSFGRDFATANCEFIRSHDSAKGRQSQTWFRMDGGWKVISAHISVIPTS